MNNRYKESMHRNAIYSRILSCASHRNLILNWRTVGCRNYPSDTAQQSRQHRLTNMPRKPLNNTAVFLETMRIAARTAEGVCTLGCCRNQARKNPPDPSTCCQGSLPLRVARPVQQLVGWYGAHLRCGRGGRSSGQTTRCLPSIPCGRIHNPGVAGGRERGEEGRRGCSPLNWT